MPGSHSASAGKSVRITSTRKSTIRNRTTIAVDSRLWEFAARARGANNKIRWLFYHPCFATRLGGVSGGKETQGWRDSSHTAMLGAGKFGSAKLPMATATYPGKPSLSQ